MVDHKMARTHTYFWKVILANSLNDLRDLGWSCVRRVKDFFILLKILPQSIWKSLKAMGKRRPLGSMVKLMAIKVNSIKACVAFQRGKDPSTALSTVFFS